MQTPITFGEWLRQRREELGLTRKELAGRVGCSVSTLRKIESGERRPSGQIAGLMAGCLHVPAEEHASFVRAARGDLSAERLFSPFRAHPGADTPLPKSNLPILPTPLIGRQREVDELSRLLRQPECRLLTLTGPGGIGKTRLAIETASGLQDFFPDGVYFVALAPIQAAQFMVPMIAEAVRFAFESASRADPRRQLFNYLHNKHLLLLTDNLEQLLAEPGIEMLAELIASAPGVKLLATSRESLELQVEWIFEVRGLPVPEKEAVQPDTQDTSVGLFLQRARRASAGFGPTPEDYPAIVRICRLVGGNPLGIELAAAWVRVLSCEEIAREIEGGLGFLSASMRDVPARHRSMRAVFDHSWRLLTEQEQGVMRRLSVFRGGFSREAAEQVAAATLSVLSALVTKSLIHRGDEGRYDLHELVRQFSAEQLAEVPDEESATHARHSSYYLAYFSQADGRLRSSAQRATLSELTAEIDNFRAAWEYAILHHDVARIHEASPTVWWLFELRTWFAEGETLFRNAAERIHARATEAGLDNEALVAINTMRARSAYFTFRLGKSLASYAALSPSAGYLQSSTDRSAAAYALWFLGIVCWELGNFAEAHESLQASLETARACGDQWCATVAEEFIGIVAHDQGEYALARQHLVDALESARAIGDPMVISHILGYLSLTTLALGETTETEKLLNESLAIVQRIDYRSGIGSTLDRLGIVAQMSDPGKARTLFASSCDVFRETGDLRSLSRVFSHQGYNSFALGDVADAQASFIAALRLAHEGGYAPYMLDALAGMASLRAKQGNLEDALDLVLIILDHPAKTQEIMERAGQLQRELESQLPGRQVKAIQARAGARTFEAAVEEALSLPDPGRSV